MKQENPRVSIGLPVYNGQKYIRFALESLISQSFADIEIIISDNASTDSTQDICMEVVRRDKRIRYHRNDRNLGASANFNKTFELSRGHYFKWASYDDICAPDFLIKCVEALDKDDSIVLAYPQTTEIDENGNRIGNFDWQLKLGSNKPSERFGELLVGHSACYEVFGVIRRELLVGTDLIGPYISSDRNLLAELALIGRFYEVPEYLFLRRDHAKTSWRALANSVQLPAYPSVELVVWFDTSMASRIQLPHCKIFYEYARSLYRVRLPFAERARCWRYLMKWLRIYRRAMQRDVVVAGRAAFRRFIHNGHRSREQVMRQD